MMLTDARRIRHDLGPGSGRGHMDVAFVNVLPSLNQDGFRESMAAGCPICGGILLPGRYACSLRCSQARFDRLGVRSWR